LYYCLLQFLNQVLTFACVQSQTPNVPHQIVMAAGNDGHKGVSTVYSPATAKNVLSVGASELSMAAYIESGAHVADYWMQIRGWEHLVPLKPAMAGFGPPFSIKSQVSGYVVFAQPSDGCAALEIEVPSGHGVVIDRGSCTFTTKAENAQAAGASFMIVVNGPTCAETSCAPITMTFSADYDPRLLTIPACMVSCKWVVFETLSSSHWQCPDSFESQISSSDGAALKNTLHPGASVDVVFPAFRPGDFQSVNLASFSSRGPTLDGRLKPDVICPGDLQT
jgi:hypothetical protein